MFLTDHGLIRDSGGECGPQSTFWFLRSENFKQRTRIYKARLRASSGVGAGTGVTDMMNRKRAALSGTNYCTTNTGIWPAPSTATISAADFTRHLWPPPNYK